jgi:hypothetical protein
MLIFQHVAKIGLNTPYYNPTHPGEVVLIVMRP